MLWRARHPAARQAGLFTSFAVVGHEQAMSRPRPTIAQIAILRYVQATRGQLADPGNLQVANQCVARGWLIGAEDDGFDLTQEGADLAIEA